jgi:hypothetical protein
MITVERNALRATRPTPPTTPLTASAAVGTRGPKRPPDRSNKPSRKRSMTWPAEYRGRRGVNTSATTRYEDPCVHSGMSSILPDPLPRARPDRLLGGSRCVVRDSSATQQLGLAARENEACSALRCRKKNKLPRSLDGSHPPLPSGLMRCRRRRLFAAAAWVLGLGHYSVGHSVSDIWPGTRTCDVQWEFHFHRKNRTPRL